MKHVILTLAILLLVPLTKSQAADMQKPNIVFILADDLGYGDVQYYDPQFSKIATPHIDRLAREGMSFLNAHASSACCTPSRYSLLTGRYNWRTRLQAGVLKPYDPPLIEPGRLTVAGLLWKQGYHTACIGKWHLGWDWPRRDGKEVFDQPIAGGPTTCGFNYYFGTDVPNYPPFTFIENDRVTVQPTETFDGGPRELFVGRKGPMAPGWKFERILPTLTGKVVSYLGERAQDKQPFFLYFPLTTPHEPIAPSEAFRGKSGISPVADLIMESDWAVGQVLEALNRHHMTDNTLVIFSSDNGHSPYTGLKAFQDAGHRVSGPFRGYKADAWEGGHHEPFVAKWPGVVKPSSRCDQLISLADFMATCADIVGAKLPADAGEDSVSILPLLRGSDRPVRDVVVSQSARGLFTIQRGYWKLILGQGSGGFAKIDTGPDQGQLYDLSGDVAEAVNVYSKHPEVVTELTAVIEKIVAAGRSTPGPSQKNAVPVRLFPKKDTAAIKGRKRIESETTLQTDG